MGRTKATASTRILEFSKAPFHVTGNSLFCTPCSMSLDYTRKSSIERHLESQLHREKTTTGQDEPAAKKQRTLDDPFLSTQSQSGEHKVTENLVKAFVGMNIPLSLLDHPLFRDFLSDHVNGGSSVPTSSWIRRDVIPKLFDGEKSRIKECLREVSVALIVDETTDAENRSILNILVKPLVPDSKAAIASVDFLNQANANEVAQKIQKVLFEYDVVYTQVRALVTDNAAYMKKCFKILSGLYVNMMHVTCWSHILSLVGNCWRDRLVSVDRFVACTKALFVKSPCRRRNWRALLQSKDSEVKSFPIPIITRWNSWFQSVKFIDQYFDEILEFIDMEFQEGTRTAKLEEMKKIALDEKLRPAIHFVGMNCSRIQRDLVSMETACPSQVSTHYVYLNVGKQTYTHRFKYIFGN